MEGQHLWAMGSSHFIGNEVNYFDKVAWLFVVVSHLLPLCHFKSHVCKPIPPISKWGGLGFRGRYRGSLNSKDICTKKNMPFKTAPYESKTKNINSTIDKLHCLNQHFSRTLCILVVVECQSHSYRDSQIFGLSLQFFTHNSFKRYLSWEIDI